jgi:hypothetical protein
VALVRVGPVRIAISALAPFRPPGWGSVGCRTFVELNLSGALDARHHLGDGGSVSGGLCQRCGTVRELGDYDLKLHAPLRAVGASLVKADDPDRDSAKLVIGRATNQTNQLITRVNCLDTEMPLELISLTVSTNVPFWRGIPEINP